MAAQSTITNPSRRLLLAALPAAALAPVPAVAAVVDADPIFALIAEHERLDRAWLEIDWRLDELSKADPAWAALEAECTVASDALHAAHDLLGATPPQTVAGVIAYLREMARYYKGCMVPDWVLENALRSPALNAFL